MSGAMNRHCDRINHVHSPDGELAGVSGNVKTEVSQGLARTLARYFRPGADTEETGRYDLAWKDLCSVLNVAQ